MHLIANTYSPIDIEYILDVVFKEFGYDFRSYSRSHVTRRIKNRMRLSNIKSVHELTDKLLEDKTFAELFFSDLSINVTEMFRDPDFYKSVREEVIPILKTWSHIKIWHAGCSTGEEVYSMAILLKEEGLLNRAQIYATDFNKLAVDKAKEGIYPIKNIQSYTDNYNKTNPKSSLSTYYHAKYDSAIIDSSIKENIIWANHNLVTDSDFTECQLVFCRNVMIYFNRDLQNRVHELIYNSLSNGGILCLGSKESLRFSGYKDLYETIDTRNKIYKKKYLK